MCAKKEGSTQFKGRWCVSLTSSLPFSLDSVVQALCNAFISCSRAKKHVSKSGTEPHRAYSSINDVVEFESGVDLAEGVVLHRQRPHQLLDLREPLQCEQTRAKSEQVVKRQTNPACFCLNVRRDLFGRGPAGDDEVLVFFRSLRAGGL